MTSNSSITDSVADLLLRVIPRLSRLIERELGRSGSMLTLRQLRVLQRLHDGEQIAAEIARESSVGPAAMQGVLDGLVDRGLVLRERSVSDRRKQLLQLTRDGETALVAGNAASVQVLDRLVEGLKPAERTAVVTAMDRLQEAVDHYVVSTRVRTTPSSAPSA